MAMLTANEFLGGPISLAKPISLLRTLDTRADEFLIAGPDNAPEAIMLEGGNAFEHFAASGNDYWSGLILTGLCVEVDENSAFDARFQRSPFGALVRLDTSLAICAKAQGYRVLEYIPLVEGLSPVGETLLGFHRWQLVLGQDPCKRIIKSIDLTPAQQKS